MTRETKEAIKDLGHWVIDTVLSSLTFLFFLIGMGQLLPPTAYASNYAGWFLAAIFLLGILIMRRLGDIHKQGNNLTIKVSNGVAPAKKTSKAKGGKGIPKGWV